MNDNKPLKPHTTAVILEVKRFLLQGLFYICYSPLEGATTFSKSKGNNIRRT